MNHWLLLHRYKKEKQLLLHAFPKALESDVNAVLAIIPFHVRKIAATDGVFYGMKSLVTAAKDTLLLSITIGKIT